MLAIRGGQRRIAQCANVCPRRGALYEGAGVHRRGRVERVPLPLRSRETRVDTAT